MKIDLIDVLLCRMQQVLIREKHDIAWVTMVPNAPHVAREFKMCQGKLIDLVRFGVSFSSEMYLALPLFFLYS